MLFNQWNCVLCQVSELSLKYTATQSDLDSFREQVPSLQTRLTEAESDKNNLTRELSEKVCPLYVLFAAYLRMFIFSQTA